MDKAKAYKKEIITEESKIMTDSTNNISANISMNGQKLEEVAAFKYLGASLSKDGTCTSGNSHQLCLSNGSNGQIKQNLAEQHHHLRKQVQDVQVSCHFHPPQ